MINARFLYWWGRYLRIRPQRYQYTSSYSIHREDEKGKRCLIYSSPFLLQSSFFFLCRTECLTDTFKPCRERCLAKSLDSDHHKVSVEEVSSHMDGKFTFHSREIFDCEGHKRIGVDRGHGFTHLRRSNVQTKMQPSAIEKLFQSFLVGFYSSRITKSNLRQYVLATLTPISGNEK